MEGEKTKNLRKYLFLIWILVFAFVSDASAGTVGGWGREGNFRNVPADVGSFVLNMADWILEFAPVICILIILRSLIVSTENVGKTLQKWPLVVWLVLLFLSL